MIRVLFAGVALSFAVAAAPAAAVTQLTFDFGGGTNNASVASIARTNSFVTLTATALKFFVAPGSLTNLSQTTGTGATIRTTTPGIGVTGGADTNQLDTNTPGTVAAPGREAILVSSSIPNFSLSGLKLSYVDNDDTLQVYGVSSTGALTSLGYGGIIKAASGSSLGGAATGVNTAANNGTTAITLMTPTAYFQRYLFTTRVGGDVSFMGTLGQGYRIDTITGSVPEPATWAMMIVGFGMVGVAARRRTTAISA